MYQQQKKRHSQEFTSIFTKQKEQRKENCTAAGDNFVESSDNDFDCTISECSSNSCCEEDQRRELEISPIRITGYSSDEDQSYNKSRSFSNSIISERHMHYHNLNWKKSVSKRQRPPSKRPLSEVHIRSKNQKIESVEPIRILAQSNSNTYSVRNFTQKTPWQKLRNVFRPVKCLKSSKFAQKGGEENIMPHKTDANVDLNETEIDWSSSESNDEAEKNSSQHISTPGTITQKSEPPTELDLFIALIESESKTNGTKRKSKLTKKCCLKGGFLYELQRTLDVAKTDRKFLEHDKKFGLQSGVCLTVLELQTSFGVHMATVETISKETNIFRVLLDVEMAKRLKVGDKVEAFFNDAFEPYISRDKAGSSIPVFVQPNKLLFEQRKSA